MVFPWYVTIFLRLKTLQITAPEISGRYEQNSKSPISCGVYLYLHLCIMQSVHKCLFHFSKFTTWQPKQKYFVLFKMFLNPKNLCGLMQLRVTGQLSVCNKNTAWGVFLCILELHMSHSRKDCNQSSFSYKILRPHSVSIHFLMTPPPPDGLAVIEQHPGPHAPLLNMPLDFCLCVNNSALERLWMTLQTFIQV
jgi:hypothetical protein